jgi:hypothetical protein
MWIMNAMTPETASATNYFWGVGRDVIHLFVDPENVDIVADAGGIQARRLLQQRIGAEGLIPARVA